MPLHPRSLYRRGVRISGSFLGASGGGATNEKRYLPWPFWLKRCGLFGMRRSYQTACPVCLVALVAMSRHCSLQCPACGADLVAEVKTSLDLMLPEDIADVADSALGQEYWVALEKRLEHLEGFERPLAEPFAESPAEPLADPPAEPDHKEALRRFAEPLERANFFSYLEKRIVTAAVACGISGSGSNNLIPMPPRLPPPGFPMRARPPSAPPSQELLKRHLVTSPKFGCGAAKQPPAKKQRSGPSPSPSPSTHGPSPSPSPNPLQSRGLA